MLEKDPKSPYVDYQYYRDTFHGSAMTEAEFPNAEIEAEAFVNAVTFGRLRRLDKIPDCVKDAICSAADVMGEYSKGMESDISSESIFGDIQGGSQIRRMRKEHESKSEEAPVRDGAHVWREVEDI